MSVSKSRGVKSSTSGESYESEGTFIRRDVRLALSLEGNPPSAGEWIFLTIFNGQIVLDGRWHDGVMLETGALSLDLKQPYYKELVTVHPLILLLRIVTGKGPKELDPLLNPDNIVGATVDLFPLIIGEEIISIRVPLLYVTTGQTSECIVNVHAIASTPAENEDKTTVPLIITMISAHCLPMAKDGTVYAGAIGLDGVLKSPVVNFGLSLSTADAEKSVWASACNAGQAANTAFSVPNSDKFVPNDLSLENNEQCCSFYWNAMSRRRVEPNLLRARLSSPFVFELAGVPRTGRVDVRGRYMAFVDAGVLLEPGQYGVSVCARVLFYNEYNLPENYGALLELPPTSAKVSARETDLIFDEYEHSTYIVIRFDLWDPLVPKVKIVALFESIGLKPPGGSAAPIDQLDEDDLPEDTTIDVRKIRKEGGALAVHKELSGLACRGAVPMNQGIKRTAANRLLMRVRSMLKQFSPGDCSYIEWQDTVTGQHAASRRAVLSSFAPQPPQIRLPPRVAASRSRMAGDNKISNAQIKDNLKKLPGNPRVLICQALRCLEACYDLDAKTYILEGLKAQPRNRFLLWIFAGQEFNKGVEASEMAASALRVGVKGDYSDGTANAIGWGALHSLHHFHENPYAAYVSVVRMRKSYELPREWKKFLQRWIDESGEEEMYWSPAIISSFDPLLITAAFFLCLRCFKFVEQLLNCVEQGCSSKGSHVGTKTKISPDIYYLRAASLILQRKFDDAMKVTTEGIKRFGPNPMLFQMRTTCLTCSRGWDGDCQIALEYSEKAGAEPSPALLLRAALGGIKTDPEAALQRAACAHKIAPCGHSALVIARIYAKMKESSLAERWAAAAVKYEPLLADGWAVLALFAMYNKHLDKARTMLRTVKQLGKMSPDIEEEVNKMMSIVQLEALPESLVKDLCLCQYY